MSAARTILLGAALVAAGCAIQGPRVRPEDLRSPQLTRALPRPNFTLQGLDGAPFDFRRETGGRLTLLFFGYTNCPDVCPLHLANLAYVIHGLPAEQARQVRVVFVTTDPERDTPERLREWLGKFDSSFVALRGSQAALDAAQQAVGMPPAQREGELPGGGYGMSHAAPIWVVSPDDSIHVMVPWGMSREDLAADLPRMLQLWRAR